MYIIRAAMAACGLVGVLVTAPAPAGAAAAVPSPDHNPAAAGVVINEFAPSGPFGSTDEFVELRNLSSQWVFLDRSALVACLSPTLSLLMIGFGPGDAIGPGGHLLLSHVDSSIWWSDFFYSGPGVPDDGGVLLSGPFGSHSDGVGLASGLPCTEEDPAPECDWDGGEAATRDQDGTDTDNNSVDFTCQTRTPGW